MPPRGVPSKREFPVTVTRGPTGLKGTAKIYFNPVKVKKKAYPSFLVGYYSMGKRQMERFADYGAAYGFAEEKATQASNGEIGAVGLKSADQRLYSSALQILEPLDVGLESALREYVDAKKVLGTVTLLEAAKFFAQHALTVTKTGTLRQILDAMLKGLEQDGRGAYHLRDIRRYVERFIKAMKSRRIEEITTSDINDWLRGLEMSLRSRDNHRNAVHNFFNYARAEGYLPKDKLTAAHDTKQVDEGGKENEVYTPEEMKRILTGVPNRLIPTLTLKAFSGLRTEEMWFLKWESIKFDRNVIIPKKVETKTKGRRIIRLKPNLRAWLEPFQANKGRIAERWKNPETLAKAWTNWIKKALGSSKKNGMRNSFISYRLAETSDIQLVALECGTSPEVIQEDYLELVTLAEADAWFSIMPPQNKD